MNKLYVSLFFIIAVIYTLSSPLAPYPLSPLVKVFPIVVLALVAYQQLPAGHRTYPLLALTFSGLGDVLLAMQFEQNFMAGLSAFLIAHVFYIICFARFVDDVQIYKARFRHLAALAMLIYSWFMAQWVMPEEVVLRYAVIVYVGVISFMCISAIFSAQTSHRLHLYGALIFAVSDSLIAWNAFRHPIPFATVWIMASYYLAQYLIIVGIIRLTAYARHEM
ncbi:lysoplasmalogenase [Planctobacterium marinum]|uniref:lysoplasmalogenase n=1 Tax=Planctobacterium marinum TaxID=1631968 RepID=UPI001E307C81|nr:lysoplasmalogenase [Planctobacterium marinum]MCC2604351.1 lysoplasmalogenase [Planctobacterium marinum]